MSDGRLYATTSEKGPSHRGTVFGVVLGALLLQLVQVSLVRWEIRGDRVDVVVGGMILAAVLFDLGWRKQDE